MKRNYLDKDEDDDDVVPRYINHIILHLNMQLISEHNGRTEGGSVTPSNVTVNRQRPTEIAGTCDVIQRTERRGNGT